MTKYVVTSLATLAIGIFGTLYTVDWQEEKLIFELGEVAQFGDITYQNIRIRNDGWNPATNVNVQLSAKNIAKENINASPKFELGPNDNRIGGYERIRRHEVVTLSFAFKGDAITPSMLSIKSDRSIAAYKVSSTEGHGIDWIFVSFLLAVITFLVGLLSAVFVPAYQDYVKKAKEAQLKSMEDLKLMLSDPDNLKG